MRVETHVLVSAGGSKDCDCRVDFNTDDSGPYMTLAQEGESRHSPDFILLDDKQMRELYELMKARFE